jgi:hypothetical protein
MRVRTIDIPAAGSAATAVPAPAGAWIDDAACREDSAPSMFADSWGAGRDARRHRAAALATCRNCVVRRQCGEAALATVEAGMSLYGVLCGVEFTDVTASRQQRDVDRLRAVIARLGEPLAREEHVVTAVSLRCRSSVEQRAARRTAPLGHVSFRPKAS